MSDIKFSAKWALLGIVLALVAFIFNYTQAPFSLPGYELLAGPGMFALSFFSEELHFWPKMSVFLSGQYSLYFITLFVWRKLSLLFLK